MTDRLCVSCSERRVKHRYVRCAHCRGSEHDLCACGSRKTRKARACQACARRRRGEDHGSWRGGRNSTSDGYMRVWAPEHPRANANLYVLEHILVMETTLGRSLFPDERVHHKNKVRDDNRPENLELWSVGHPAGARVTDLLAWAQEVIVRYEGVSA